MIKNFLLVGLGGFIGSTMRYAIGLLLRSNAFPVATLFVNITGSFVIGLLFGLTLKNETFSMNWRLFLTTGICGGFTTFSAFSVENLQILQDGKYTLSLLYICSSILFGIAAAWFGFKLVTN